MHFQKNKFVYANTKQQQIINAKTSQQNKYK